MEGQRFQWREFRSIEKAWTEAILFTIAHLLVGTIHRPLERINFDAVRAGRIVLLLVVVDIRILDLHLAGIGESFDVQARTYLLLVRFWREFFVYIPFYLTAILCGVIEFPRLLIKCKSLRRIRQMLSNQIVYLNLGIWCALLMLYLCAFLLLRCPTIEI